MDICRIAQRSGITVIWNPTSDALSSKNASVEFPNVKITRTTRYSENCLPNFLKSENFKISFLPIVFLSLVRYFSGISALFFKISSFLCILLTPNIISKTAIMPGITDSKKMVFNSIVKKYKSRLAVIEPSTAPVWSIPYPKTVKKAGHPRIWLNQLEVSISLI